jgi:hypothetical protein
MYLPLRDISIVSMNQLFRITDIIALIARPKNVSGSMIYGAIPLGTISGTNTAERRSVLAMVLRIITVRFTFFILSVMEPVNTRKIPAILPRMGRYPTTESGAPISIYSPVRNTPRNSDITMVPKTDWRIKKSLSFLPGAVKSCISFL